jgi:hypothetical protein
MPAKSNFLRGAIPTPRHKLAAAMPFSPLALGLEAPPPQCAYVPAKLDVWGNSTYGDCVSAEEAFAKACNVPEIFLSADVVISWARKHGFLNGADLVEVMDAVAKNGFVVGSQEYKDGGHQSVDFSNEPILQAALAEGPVKIGIDAGALPSGAGNQQGWYAQGGRSMKNEDHCVGLAGYGPAEWLYGQLGVPTPSALPASKSGYLLFTWSTIGFVDHDWIMSTVGEAWVRNPTTVGVPPLPDPVPVTPPDVIDW